jgi:hypothetical protein
MQQERFQAARMRRMGYVGAVNSKDNRTEAESRANNGTAVGLITYFAQEPAGKNGHDRSDKRCDAAKPAQPADQKIWHAVPIGERQYPEPDDINALALCRRDRSARFTGCSNAANRSAFLSGSDEVHPTRFELVTFGSVGPLLPFGKSRFHPMAIGILASPCHFASVLKPTPRIARKRGILESTPVVSGSGLGLQFSRPPQNDRRQIR